MFFYLLCLVPTIWFLELDEMDKRIREREIKNNSTTPLPTTTNYVEDDITTAASDGILLEV